MGNSQSSQIRVAIIGLGKMGLLHASLLSVLPNVKLVALCDKSSLIRKICRRLFHDVFITDDVEQLTGLDLDAVYITTPIPSHFSIAKTIYSKRIADNLFVEKTLAANYDEAKKMCELAKASGGVNMVGYMKRFAVTFNKAKELLDKGVLGDLVSFDAYSYSSDFVDAKEGSVSTSRGGVLGDLGSHVLDLALWFFGDLKVDSAKLVSIHSFSAEDVASFKVSASNGLEGQFDISWCKKGFRMPESGLAIRGTKGKIMVNDDELRLELVNGESRRWYRHDLNDSVGFLLGAPEYFREDKYFIECVLNGCNGEPNFSTASKVDYLIDQVKREAEKNG
jgi:predicted dehydrogenase